MKRTLLVFLLVFIAMQLIQTEKKDVAVEKELEIKAPEHIMTMFKNACYDCHSNEIKWPWYSYVAPFSWVIAENANGGVKALNFSIWETYSEEEKKKHLKDIYRTAYAAMPIPSYIWFHDEADLTKEQRKIIREWTGVRKKR